MPETNENSLIPYYNGQVAALAKCCTLMTALATAVVSEETNDIDPKYLIARTGEAMLRIFDTANQMLEDLKKGEK